MNPGAHRASTPTAEGRDLGAAVESLRRSRGDTDQTLGGDTLGGHAIVVFLIGALGYPVAARLIDGAHQVSDAAGRMTVVDNGRADTIVGVGCFCAAVAAACLALLAPARRRLGSAVSLFLQLLVVWWVMMSLLIPRTPSLQMSDLVIVGAVPLVLGVVNAPPSLTTVRRVNLLRDLFATGQLIYPFLAPELARVPCRTDKCGIFGHLDTGFFTQENTGIAAISLLLPLAAVSSRSHVLYSSTAALLVALASGSRTGITSTVVAIAVALYLRRRLRDDVDRPVTISRFLLIAPLVATLASLALFLFADPSALTGRGSVYAANLHALQGPALWYGVPWNTVEVASDGYLVGDHGQASHVLARAGMVGFGLWTCAVAAPLWRRRFGPEEVLGVGLLAAGSSRMLTESTFELEARTVGFLALLLVAGLCARRAVSRTDRVGSGMRRSAAPLVTALVTGVVVFVLLPVALPPRYTARTVIAVSVPVSDARAGEEGRTARTHLAASAEAIGASRALLSAMNRPASEQISVSRTPGSTALQVTTSGTDDEATRRDNDRSAATISRVLSTEKRGSTGTVTRVRPVGDSMIERVAPWRSRFPQTMGAAGIAAGLAFALAAALVRRSASRPSTSGD